MNNKIQKIIHQYVSENKCRCWNIDTNILKTWNRFKNLLNKNFDLKKFNYTKCFVRSIQHPRNNKDNYYIFEIGNKNLTPSNRCKEGWSGGGMRQFLQEGSAFGLIMFNEGKVNNKEFNISSSLIQICDDNFNWHELIMDLLIRALNSKTKHIKNLGWSIFYALLIKHDEDVLQNMKQIFIFKWISARGGRNASWKSNSFEAIQVGKQLYDETYSNIVNSIMNYYGLEEIINRLYSTLENTNENIILTISEQQAQYANQLINMINYLNRSRFELRQNIINTRCLGLTRYSDIVMNNTDEPFLKFQDACHLYDVYRIKDEIRFYLEKDPYTSEEVLRKICDQASDPNNGLIMDKNIHKAFDEKLFEFNCDGKIIYQKENEKIISSLNLTNSYIKKEVLNDKMLGYIRRKV